MYNNTEPLTMECDRNSWGHKRIVLPKQLLNFASAHGMYLGTGRTMYRTMRDGSLVLSTESHVDEGVKEYRHTIQESGQFNTYLEMQGGWMDDFLAGHESVEVTVERAWRGTSTDPVCTEVRIVIRPIANNEGN